jgi:lysophospholipase L1-like esterase
MRQSLFRRCSTALLTASLFGLAAGALAEELKPIRIALIGDSTQTEKQGYGIGFCANLVPAVSCINNAKGGASTKTYRRDGLWERALAGKPDWMLIQFGHNDVESKSHSDRETKLETEYPANLRRYIEEARAAGIKPILVTSIARRYYQPNGKIEDDLMGHVAAMKKVAEEMQVPLLDLHTLSVERMEALGEVEGHKLGLTKLDAEGKTVPDKTHFNLAGSYVFGRIVAEGMARTVPELAPYVKSSPAQPTQP